MFCPNGKSCVIPRIDMLTDCKNDSSSNARRPTVANPLETTNVLSWASCVRAASVNSRVWLPPLPLGVIAFSTDICTGDVTKVVITYHSMGARMAALQDFSLTARIMRPFIPEVTFPWGRSLEYVYMNKLSRVYLTKSVDAPIVSFGLNE